MWQFEVQRGFRNRRILNLFGRVSVAQTLILPKLNHLFISLPTPYRSLLSTLGNALFQFCGSRDVPRLKEKTLDKMLLKIF